jgi:hypothetical protein
MFGSVKGVGRIPNHESGFNGSGWKRKGSYYKGRSAALDDGGGTGQMDARPSGVRYHGT